LKDARPCLGCFHPALLPHHVTRAAPPRKPRLPLSPLPQVKAALEQMIREDAAELHRGGLERP
jgi:hypothetical protein